MVQAEGCGFGSQECAGKQQEHYGEEPEARDGPKLQKGMRYNRKQIDNRGHQKKMEMHKLKME